MTEELLQLVKKKTKAFIDWQDYIGETSEGYYKNRYKALAKLVKRSIDKCQKDHWEQLSSEIEAAVKQHDSTVACK